MQDKKHLGYARESLMMEEYHQCPTKDLKQKIIFSKNMIMFMTNTMIVTSVPTIKF